MLRDIDIPMLDDLDRRLLRQLQADPSLSQADLAERAGVSPLKAGRRIARLEQAGVLRPRRAVIDWAALGYEVAVSLRITLDKTAPRAFDEFLAAARDIPEVTEIQTFLGRVDLRLMVLARDMAHYQALYRDRILALPHIADIEALVTVSTLKDDRSLPL
ncbi:MAG: Lrp/AsnC family transcriptional regulator [Rhodobacteraceae bacterium HLUCCA08]|nr:MAG: Lrp/AsnC family transcriptional regulator [Rhodobacteraceae bacterium HLUCCA08]